MKEGDCDNFTPLVNLAAEVLPTIKLPWLQENGTQESGKLSDTEKSKESEDKDICQKDLATAKVSKVAIATKDAQKTDEVPDYSHLYIYKSSRRSDLLSAESDFISLDNKNQGGIRIESDEPLPKKLKVDLSETCLAPSKAQYVTADLGRMQGNPHKKKKKKKNKNKSA